MSSGSLTQSVFGSEYGGSTVSQNVGELLEFMESHRRRQCPSELLLPLHCLVRGSHVTSSQFRSDPVLSYRPGTVSKLAGEVLHVTRNNVCIGSVSFAKLFQRISEYETPLEWAWNWQGKSSTWRGITSVYAVWVSPNSSREYLSMKHPVDWAWTSL